MDWPSWSQLPNVMFTCAAVLRKLGRFHDAVKYVKYLLAHKRPPEYPEHEILLQLGWTFEKLAEASESAFDELRRADENASRHRRSKKLSRARRAHLNRLASESPVALTEDANKAYDAAFQAMQEAARSGHDISSTTPRPSSRGSTRPDKQARRALAYTHWKEWRNDPKAWLRRGLRFSANGDDMFAVRDAVMCCQRVWEASPQHQRASCCADGVLCRSTASTASGGAGQREGEGSHRCRQGATAEAGCCQCVSHRTLHAFANTAPSHACC